MKELCRLCGKTKCTVINIFGPEAGKFLLFMKITASINIYLSETDPFPKTVCTLCLGKLDNICEFQDMCRRTQILFRKVLMVTGNKTSEDVRDSLHKNPESTQNSLVKNEKSLSNDSRQTSQINQIYLTDGICGTVPYGSDHSQMTLNGHQNQAMDLMFTDNKLMIHNNAHNVNDPLFVTGPTLPQNASAMLTMVSPPFNCIVQQRNDLPSSQTSVLSNIVIPAEQYSLVNAPISTSFSRIPAIITDPNESLKSVPSNVQMPLISQNICTLSPVQHESLPSCSSTAVFTTPAASPEVVNMPAASPEVVNLPAASPEAANTPTAFPHVLNSHFASSGVVITNGITSEDTSLQESDETSSSASSLISLAPSDLPAPPSSNSTSQNKKIVRRRTRHPSLTHNGESDLPIAFVNESSACHTSGNASPNISALAQTESSILLSSETVIIPTIQQSSIRKSNLLPPCTIAPTVCVSALKRSVDLMTSSSSALDTFHGSSVGKLNLLPPSIASAHLSTRNQNSFTAEIEGGTHKAPNSSSKHQTLLEPLNWMKFTCTDATVSTPESGATDIVLLEESPTPQVSMAPSKCIRTTITMSTVLNCAADEVPNVPSTLQATESVQSANTVSPFESSATNKLRTENSTIQTRSKCASSINAVSTVGTDEVPNKSSTLQICADAGLDFAISLDRDRVEKSNAQTTVMSHDGGIPASSSLASSPTIPSETLAVGEQKISRDFRLATHSKSTVPASSSDSTDDNIVDGNSGWQKYPVGDTFKSSGVGDTGSERIQQLSRGSAQLGLLPKCCPSCSCVNIFLVAHSTFYCHQCNEIFALHQNDSIGKLHYECSTCDQKSEHYSKICQDNNIHKRDSFSCDFCKRVRQKDELKRHIQTVHLNIRNHKCSKCDKAFTWTDLLKSHMARHDETASYKRPKEVISIDKKNCSPVKESHCTQESYKCKECDITFNNKYQLESHQLEHTGSKYSLFCDICGLEFSEKGNLVAHIKTVHLKSKNYKCSKCDETFSTRYYLNIHKDKHDGILSNSREKCKECDSTFRYKYQLQSHQLEHIGNKDSLCCNICGKELSSQRSLMAHMEAVHLNIRNHKCSICDKSFTKKFLLKDHMQKHDGTPSYLCSICGISKCDLTEHIYLKRSTEIPHKCNECDSAFKYKYQLESHQLKHAGKKESYFCGICGMELRTKQILEVHMQGVHLNIRNHICSICDKAFTKKSHLTVHMKRHDGPPSHLCSICGISKYTKGDLTRHFYLMHSTEMPHKCNECNSAFKTKPKLMLHQLEHTGEKESFSCDFCIREFREKYKLERHMQTVHLNIKNHKCSICDKSYTNKSKLKDHMKRHDGIPSYLCSICGISKYTKCNLTKHIYLKHSTEMRHKCNECDSTFKTKQRLKMHELVHTGEKPFCCDQCGKSFARSFTLDIHIKCVHMPKSITCPLCPNKFSHKSNLKTHLDAHAKQKNKFVQKKN